MCSIPRTDTCSMRCADVARPGSFGLTGARPGLGSGDMTARRAGPDSETMTADEVTRATATNLHGSSRRWTPRTIDLLGDEA